MCVAAVCDELLARTQDIQPAPGDGGTKGPAKTQSAVLAQIGSRLARRNLPGEDSRHPVASWFPAPPHDLSANGSRLIADGYRVKPTNTRSSTLPHRPRLTGRWDGLIFTYGTPVRHRAHRRRSQDVVSNIGSKRGPGWNQSTHQRLSRSRRCRRVHLRPAWCAPVL